jgi:hypothetical protein
VDRENRRLNENAGWSKNRTQQTPAVVKRNRIRSKEIDRETRPTASFAHGLKTERREPDLTGEKSFDKEK